MPQSKVTITGADQFSPPFMPIRDSVVEISVGGQPVGTAFGAVVTLQRRLDGGDWRPVSLFTEADEVQYLAGSVPGQLRIGCDTGDFASGGPISAICSYDGIKGS